MRTCQSRASSSPGSRPWLWASQLHASSNLATSVALCCVIKLHILEWPFIVTSPRHSCVLTVPFNQHPDMPHLSGGWIILAKEKCALTQIKTNLWIKFECVEKVWNVLFQLKNGSENKSVVFIFLFRVAEKSGVHRTQSLNFTHSFWLLGCFTVCALARLFSSNVTAYCQPFNWQWNLNLSVAKWAWNAVLEASWLC